MILGTLNAVLVVKFTLEVSRAYYPFWLISDLWLEDSCAYWLLVTCGRLLIEHLTTEYLNKTRAQVQFVGQIELSMGTCCLYMGPS